jgi:hypothetical protein
MFGLMKYTRACASDKMMAVPKHFLSILLLSLAACNKATSPSPIKAIATREEIMHHLVIPNAKVVWDASGTIFTKDGVIDRKPKNEDEWFTVEASATTLMEAGNLLMMDGRAMDNGKWIERALALRDASDAVRQAAKKKDIVGLFDRGGDLFETCQGCHFQYRFTKDEKMTRTH